MTRIFLRRVVQSIGVTILSLSSVAHAANFSLPASNQALIGNVDHISAATGDTTITVAERYNLGLNAVMAANPGITTTTAFPVGSTVTVNKQFLLPPLPRKGIVVNLPEMRMYYYPEGSDQVMTFPVGIGKIGKIIPIMKTSIARKVTNPVWIPPADIRQYDREVLGINPPAVMPAGPDNPLGPYGIYLRIPTYLIHSTIFPESIGTRASFGCIRMNEADIKQFFPLVKPGTVVELIDMPNKIAWDGDELYLEAHPPLEDRTYDGINGLVQTITSNLPRNHVTLVNWQLVAYIEDQPDGIPHEIGVQLN